LWTLPKARDLPLTGETVEEAVDRLPGRGWSQGCGSSRCRDGLITDVDVLPGNAHDSEKVMEVVERPEEALGTGTTVGVVFWRQTQMASTPSLPAKTACYGA